MWDPQPHKHVSAETLELFVDFEQMRAAGEEAAWQWLATTGCPDCWARFNELRWRRSEGHPEIGELRRYLGDRFEDGRDGTLELANRWRALNPQTAEEIADFYRSAEDYLYDLALFHASGERRDYSVELAKLASEYECGSALEYGCGIGSDGLDLMKAGIAVSFMDYDGPSTRYLRWRLKHRGLPNDQLFTVGEDDVPEADLVFALDVFEHLPDPEAMAEVLAGRARRLLVYNLLFRVDSDTICPMHLPDHDPVAAALAIEGRLEAMGLIRVSDDPLLTVRRR